MAILHIVSPGIELFDFDYWVMHFVAALRALADQKTLAARMNWRREWSLNDLRGMNSSDLVPTIRTQAQNFGAQYLLADAIARKEWVRRALLEGLAEANGEPWILEAQDVECVVAGNDTHSGESFLRSCKARIFLDRRRRVHTSSPLVQRSDLCLLVRRDDSEETVAFFGEVEGNHGYLLNQRSFWAAKPSLSSFGIGLSQAQASFTRQNLKLDGDREIVVLMFGTNANLLRDFHLAWFLLEYMIREGPSEAWIATVQPNMRDCLRFLLQSWRVPILELLHLVLESPSASKFQMKDHSVATTGSLDLPESISLPDALALP